MHGFGVEPAVVVVPHEMPRKNVADLPVVDYVAIALTNGVIRGMEALGRFGHLQHGDVIRQVGVERAQQHFRRQRRVGAEPNHLAQGVNPGVGPAAGQHAHPLPGDFGDGIFQRFLNGGLAELILPAGVGRAVVGDGELEGSQ